MFELLKEIQERKLKKCVNDISQIQQLTISIGSMLAM